MRKIIATTTGEIMRRHSLTAETMRRAPKEAIRLALLEARMECSRHGATTEELAAYFNITPAGISRRINKKQP